LTGDFDIIPDDLFYIGFHFMEEGEELRPFALAILGYIVKKFPRSKIAALAQEKIALYEQDQSAAAAASTGKAKARSHSAAVAPAAAGGDSKAASAAAVEGSRPSRLKAVESGKSTPGVQEPIKTVKKTAKPSGERLPLKQTAATNRPIAKTAARKTIPEPRPARRKSLKKSPKASIKKPTARIHAVQPPRKKTAGKKAPKNKRRARR
jgi:hypothetical protein